jgi:hypothetical protein
MVEVEMGFKTKYRRQCTGKGQTGIVSAILIQRVINRDVHQTEGECNQWKRFRKVTLQVHVGKG